MKRLVTTLVVALLALGVGALVSGCQSSVQTKPTPEASNTPVVQKTTTGTASPLPANTATAQPEQGQMDKPSKDAQHVPTPSLEDDDALEFLSTEPGISLAEDEGISTSDKNLSVKTDESEEAAQSQPYTWEDGDRTLTVYLQSDLVMEKGAEGLPRDIVEADEGGSNVVRSARAQTKSDTLPVFRSESGELMTLPGGVLLVLNPQWSQSDTDAFFARNGIKLEIVSDLVYATNGFFIETGPGFPSLDLANKLAKLDGVEVSSPNWGREAVPK